MKRLTLAIVSLAVVVVSTGCGGGSGQASRPEGPILSIDQIQSLLVDQFYVNGGMEDEYGNKGEFSVYLRDAATGKDMACTSADGGMKRLSASGIYYGGLKVPLIEAEGEHPSLVARFQVIFVEQDSEGCPNKIDSSSDDIAGESAEFAFEGLLGSPIWATNGKAVVVIRSEVDEAVAVAAMLPATEDSLSVDQLYFKDDTEDDSRYYIFAESIKDGAVEYQCQIDDTYMQNIRHGDIIYGSLGFPFSCFDPSDPAFSTTKVRVGVYIQQDSGPELVAETKERAIGDLIGEKVSFEDDKGYISFRGVVTTK